MNINEAQRVITDAVGRMGPGALSEEALVQHIHPLFSRVLARNEKSSEIYLANHSLGRPMDMVSDLVQGALDGWYEQLDGVWNAWLDARDRYRAAIAAMLCWPDERAVVPKTSAAQGLRAVLNAVPVQMPSIVSTECEFDSIDFSGLGPNRRAFVTITGTTVEVFVTCFADLNADGQANFFDASEFMVLYQQQDPMADLNGDGQFNFFDVSAFLSAYDMGC